MIIVLAGIAVMFVAFVGVPFFGAWRERRKLVKERS